MKAKTMLMTAALIAASANAAGAAETQLLHDRAPSERPKFLLVGVAHFANPGLDAINVKIDDVLAPKRQREIEALVDRLAAFKPTHVAVEWPIAKQAKLDERYRQYRAGKYTLSRNEVDQIGLRLAAKLGLERVDAADWSEMPPGKEADYDFDAWAKAHGEHGRLAKIFDPAIAKQEQDRLAHSTIIDYLCSLNTAAYQADDNRRYFDIAMIGDDTDHPGADWVGSWYSRNLKIFARLVRIADRPEDRLLAIFGAGHGFMLREDARQSGAFDVVDTGSVLGCR